MNGRWISGRRRERQDHEEPRMPLESRFQERPRDDLGFMREQLCLDAVNPGGLLQGLNDMRKQPDLDIASIGQAAAIRDEEVADHAFAPLVHEEGIAKYPAAINGGIAR